MPSSLLLNVKLYDSTLQGANVLRGVAQEWARVARGEGVVPSLTSCVPVIRIGKGRAATYLTALVFLTVMVEVRYLYMLVFNYFHILYTLNNFIDRCNYRVVRLGYSVIGNNSGLSKAPVVYR